VLPDSAVAYLLAHERIDAVLLGAEWIAANGDTANVIGSRAVAELAAIAAPNPVPVYVCAPTATIDASTPDGAAIPVELRPGRDLATNVTGFRPERVTAFVPANDVIPANRITGIITERGVLDPTDPGALVPTTGEPVAVPG
jgi:methylthioribose-1-phosphate isomerase